MTKVLVAAQDFPLPPNNGARLDIWGRVQALHRLNISIDVIATVKEMPSDAQLQTLREYASRVILVERQRAWRSVLSPRPFSVMSRVGVKDVLLSDQYDAVILEAEHMAPIFDNPQLRAAKKILRVHNHEANVHLQFVKIAGLRDKLFHLSEAAKFSWFSRQVFDRCDQLWFISNDELKAHLASHAKDRHKSFFVPPSIDLEEMAQPKLEGGQVLFIGALGVVQNSVAVEWYMRNVHQKLTGLPGYRFVAAGNSLGRPLDKLSSLVSSIPGASMIADPESLLSLYGSSAVFVNPVRQGAGVKVKVLHAILAGLPVVSTSVGMEGTKLVPGKHILMADSAEEFAAHVRSLLTDRDLARKLVTEAQAFLREEYDCAKNLARLL